MTIPEYPITREEMYLDAIARGEGGSGVTVTPLSATENGTYTAPSGTAYSPVAVNVSTPTPTLVSKTVTANGTYDPTDDSADGYSSVHVIVQADTNALDSFVNNTLTAYSNHNLTKVRANVFNSSNITTFDLPNVTTIETAAFRGCHIKRAFFPLAEAQGEAFSYSLVESTVLRSMSRWYSGVFYYCGSLKSVDVLNASTIPDNTFAGSTSFDTLILRGDTATVLNSTGAFTNSPFASGKSGGTLYVPSALIASYQAATNWSTVLGYPNNRIEAIEGSVYETQYADGTPIA